MGYRTQKLLQFEPLLTEDDISRISVTIKNTVELYENHQNFDFRGIFYLNLQYLKNALRYLNSVKTG